MGEQGWAARWALASEWLLAALLFCGPRGGSGFELKCYQGTGETQPSFQSLGARAMVFPNEHWNEGWLNAYLALHPELKTYDAFGFETGYSIDFNFDAGQPPDEERFKALVVDGTNIPESSVKVVSYRQTMTWRMRLPSGRFDHDGRHVPAGPGASKYAGVTGPRSVTCSNLDEDNNRKICNSDPCACNLQAGTWACAGAAGCAGHAVMRSMVTSLAAVESDNTEEDIRAYNDWVATATADLTVADSRFPAEAGSTYPCLDQDGTTDCYPSVEANLTLTYNGDKSVLNEGYPGSLFRQNLMQTFNRSISIIDPNAAMRSIDTSVYLTGLTNRPTDLRLPYLDSTPHISTVVEYEVDSLVHCNSTVAATQRFERADLNDDRRLNMDEFERMLYEMGRRHENGRQGVGVAAASTVAAVADSDGDGLLSFEELLGFDARRDVLQQSSLADVVNVAGWMMTSGLSAVTDNGDGLAAVSAPPTAEPDDGLLDVTKESVGACIVDSGLDNTYVQKYCIITELLGIPEVKSSEVRCVRKESVDLFQNPIVEYQCVDWELCGTVPDPAYASNPVSSQSTFEYNCEFSGCTPDALRFGNDELTPAINDFRCWDSCLLASGMDECGHIEQRSTHCRHGEPCFFVDTLDPAVSNDREAALKLLNITTSINDYAGECRQLFGDVGYVEECRHMRCHALGSANGPACDNVVPPPCRSVCEGYTDHLTHGMSLHPSISGCNPSDPPPSPSSEDWWTYVHCQALLIGNCSAFPPDSEAESGRCTRPSRYEGGMPCVREAECLSQSCPLAHSDESPVVEGIGRVCCNVGLNSCSGHGVCTAHHDSTSPKSLGPRMPVEHGACVCELEWTGVDCSKWMMPPQMFFIIVGTFAAMTFGSLTWGTFWLAWYWRVHEPPPPPKAQKPPARPPKPVRESDSEDVSDESEDEYGQVGCKLQLVVCNCKDLPQRKGILDTYVLANLDGRKKRTSTCRNGGNAPKWRPPPSTPGISYGTPPATPSTAGNDTGEQLSWRMPRGHYRLTLEAWNDESRFQHGSKELVDTLVCRGALLISDPLVHPIPGLHGSEVQDVELYDKDGIEAGVMRVRLFWNDPGSPAGFSFGQGSPRGEARTAANGPGGSTSGSNVQVLKVAHAEDSTAAPATMAASLAPRPPTGPAPNGARTRALGPTSRVSEPVSTAEDVYVEGGEANDLDGMEKQIMDMSNQDHSEGKEDVLAQAEAVLEGAV